MENNQQRLHNSLGDNSSTLNAHTGMPERAQKKKNKKKKTHKAIPHHDLLL